MEGTDSDTLDSRFIRKVFMNKAHKLRDLTMKDTAERKETSVGDLSKKTKPELVEMLQRQQKLLANKAFIRSLPDKGAKLRALKERIEDALRKKDEFSDLSDLFTKLNLNSRTKLRVESLEWGDNHGAISNGHDHEKYYSDEEEEQDPLKVLATPQYGGHSLKAKHAEERLVNDADTEEIQKEELKTHKEKPKVDFLEGLAIRLDTVTTKGPLFQPWRTLKSTKSSSSKCKPSWWEVTAATPPDDVYGKAVTLSLVESMKLEKEQIEKKKVMELNQAVDRLRSSTGGPSVGSYSGGGSYRDIVVNEDTSEESDLEEESS